MEIVVAVLLSSILIVALLRFLTIGYPLSRITYLQTRSTETARVQLRRMAKAIRQARSSDTGAFAIEEASPQRLIFYTDVNGDNVTERMRYELSGTNLIRGVTVPTGNPLQYNVNTETSTTITSSVRNGANPIFVYYDGDFPENPDPLDPVDVTDVKYIEFILDIDVDTNNDPPPITVRSQVQVRNLKSNLGEVDP